MSLEARLKERILEHGPMTVAEYMTACLHDPAGGYYAAHPGLGPEGDFITAPLVSQMFGELVGLWAAETWSRMGRPERFALAEIGPGDGTLMEDVLRAGRAAPGFLAAAELWLVETSRPLRALQAERLGPSVPRWTESLDALPREIPLIVLANEVLDCLPARQFVRTGGRWCERRIGLDAEGKLAFGLGPAPSGFAAPAEAPEGVVVEISLAQENFAETLAERIVRQGGAALLIDYGRDRPGPGDTLQALKRHRKIDPLTAPGEADLTVHADFPAVAAAAVRAGAQATAIRTQRDFLLALGVEQRARQLARSRPDRADVVGRQLRRLIAPEEMGELFKALAIHAPGLELPGFES